MSETNRATATVKTWGDLKRLVESIGVQDDDEIDYIDIMGGRFEVDVHLEVSRHGDRVLTIMG